MSLPAQILDLNALLLPISEQNPGGANLRYDAVLDNLREARREDDGLSKGEWSHQIKKADWRQVIETSRSALSRKSKDLEIAAYLTEALLQEHGFSGLREGLLLVRALLEQFWDSLYPEKEEDDCEARAARLEWLVASLTRRLTHMPISCGTTRCSFGDRKRAGELERLAASLKDEEKYAFQKLKDEEKELPERFKKAVAASPTGFYSQLLEEIAASRQELERLVVVAEAKFGAEGLSFRPLQAALEECSDSVHEILKSKPQPEPAQPPATVYEAEPKPAQDDTPIAAVVPERADVPPTASAVNAQHSDAVAQAVTPVEHQGNAFEAAPVHGAATANAQETPVAPVQDAGSQDAPQQRWPVPETRDEAIANLVHVTRILRSLAPSNPVCFLVARAICWGVAYELASALPGQELAAPPSPIRAELKRLHEEQKWREVVEHAEQAMARAEGRGWLDVQRYLLDALSHLGEEYAAARRAVRSALQGYLVDHPELPQAELHDGTPAASAATRDWLAREIFVQKPLASVPEEGNTAPAPVNEGPPEPWGQALAKSQSGQLAEAIALLRSELLRSQAPREKFLCKLQIAELCLYARRPDLSRPLLEELIFFMDEFKLERWESKEMNVRFWRAVYRCFHDLGGKREADRQHLKRAFDRLCQLDVEQAFGLSTGE